FRKDPCGIICIALTYAMLLHCLYVILFIIIIPLLNESLYGTLHALITCTFVFLCVFSHARASYFDPGFVPLPKKGIDFSDVKMNDNNKENNDGWTVCNRCDTYRPARSHHCRICRRCVRRLDHHCPWINNCVGEFNQKYFMLFLFYVDEHARTTQQILPPAKVLLRKVFGPGPIIFWLLPCDLKSSNDAIDLREMHNV
ncbi:unnamed protein product, partial [Rotaria magnacalcarata]